MNEIVLPAQLTTAKTSLAPSEAEVQAAMDIIRRHNAREGLGAIELSLLVRRGLLRRHARRPSSSPNREQRNQPEITSHRRLFAGASQLQINRPPDHRNP